MSLHLRSCGGGGVFKFIIHHKQASVTDLSFNIKSQAAAALPQPRLFRHHFVHVAIQKRHSAQTGRHPPSGPTAHRVRGSRGLRLASTAMSICWWLHIHTVSMSIRTRHLSGHRTDPFTKVESKEVTIKPHFLLLQWITKPSP